MFRPTTTSHHLSTLALMLSILLTLFVSAPQNVDAQTPTFDPKTVCPYASAPSYESNPALTQEAFEAEVIRLVNQERAKYGLWPLKLNSTLTTVARAHNQDMVTRNYFAHTNPDGLQPSDRAKNGGYPTYGWGGAYVGENLAAGYGTPASAMGGWMTSKSGHCEGVLDPSFREIGVGYLFADGSQWRNYWTMDMGSAPKMLPAFINGGTTSTNSRSVTVTLTDETVSNYGSIGRVQTVQLSENPNLSGAVAQPMPVAPYGLNFQLSAGSGQKTVYVRYRDAQGRTADTSSSIMLNDSSVEPTPLPTVLPTALPTPLPTQTPSRLENAVTVLLDRSGRTITRSRIALGESSGSWTISENSDWISISPSSGSGPIVFDLTVDASALTAGTHETAIIVASSSSLTGIQQTSSLPIRLVVAERLHLNMLSLVTR